MSALGVGYHYQGLDGVLVEVGHSLVVPGSSELFPLMQYLLLASPDLVGSTQIIRIRRIADVIFHSLTLTNQNLHCHDTKNKNRFCIL